MNDKIKSMKPKLIGKGQRALPEKLAVNMLELYRRGRAKVFNARYGNPTGTVRLIAVTGAYGKTTTARLIDVLLKESGRNTLTLLDELHTQKDIVSWLPRKLKQAKQDNVDFCILEITPQLMESGVLSGLSLDTVVVTSRSAEADILLKQAVNYAVVPDDYQGAMLAIAEHQIISFGELDSAEAKIDNVTLYRKGTEVKLTIDHHTALTASTHLVGKANAFNIAAAIATAYVLGVALDTVEEGVARLEGVEGNYQYIPSEQPYTTVVDAATNDRSVELAAFSAKELKKRRLIVALETTGISEEAIALVKKLSDRLILVGSNISMPGVETVSSPEEASLLGGRAAKKDDTLLLMGKIFTMEESAKTPYENS
jgi:UDP-N-acetylmuramoyl-L-alanyl-D-glutamate--2,6-diaminopimelate ligase